MSNEILNYQEIYDLYGNLEYGDFKTEMFGNTFYIYKTSKRIFRKPKREDYIILCCACGVHKQTFIDILKSYNFRNIDIKEVL